MSESKPRQRLASIRTAALARHKTATQAQKLIEDLRNEKDRPIPRDEYDKAIEAINHLRTMMLAHAGIALLDERGLGR